MGYLRGSNYSYANNYRKSLKQTVAKDLRKLKRQVQLNKGELKAFSITSNTLTITSGVAASYGLTAIAQGDDDHQRTGRKVRVVGIKVRMYVEDPDLDVFILKSTDHSVPSYGDFEVALGGQVTQDARHDVHEIAYLKPRSTTPNMIEWQKKWKTGIPVYYKGTSSTDAIKNALHLFIKNNTGVVVGYQPSVVVYYYD